MNRVMMKITGNKKIAEKTYFMSLEGDTSAITKPGQFVNIKLDGFFLRRPISVCDCEEGKLSIIYKVVGNGTKKMSELPVGDELDILSGLGNGYDTSKSGEKPVLIGGGAGVPPMYMLCKNLVAEGKKVTVILGFNSEKEVFGIDEFKATGAEVHVTTVDGSVGTKGFVTNVLSELIEKGDKIDEVIAIGPLIMMKNVVKVTQPLGIPTNVSLNPIMIDGTGMCGGCRVSVGGKTKFACVDGPDFNGFEVDFDECMKRQTMFKEEEHQCKIGRGV